MKKYLLAFELPEPLFRKYEAIREAYRAERWVRRIGPHITLMPSIVLSDPVPLVKICQSTAQEVAPFELQLDGLDRFHNPGGTVIFARVARNSSLEKLHHLLREQIGQIAPQGWRSPWPYTPHLTLANKVSPQEETVRWERMNELPIDERFTCTGFSLYYQTPENRWQAIEWFTLGK